MGFILLRVGNRGSEKTLFVQSVLSHYRIIHKHTTQNHEHKHSNMRKHETTRPVVCLKLDHDNGTVSTDYAT